MVCKDICIPLTNSPVVFGGRFRESLLSKCTQISLFPITMAAIMVCVKSFLTKREGESQPFLKLENALIF